MKNQPFFTKLKKIFSYPFNWEFIKNQQKAIGLLDDICNSRNKDSKSYQYTVDLHNRINKCWNRHDVTLFLSVEISKLLKSHINMQIFDLKTKWFLWEKIFLSIDLIQDQDEQTTIKSHLRLLHRRVLKYTMYNWSTDTKELKKNPTKHTIWKLESLINFGLNGKKLNRKQLVKHLPNLHIDPQKRNFLNFLLGTK